MAIQDILQQSSFGARVAEEESKQLEKYFVSTDQWTRTFNGEVDIIYGAKGSGKSAIYSLLVQRESELFDKRILIVSAENPRGTPVFKDLQKDPPISEPEFISLWKLYFLSLVGSTLKEFSAGGQEAEKIYKVLEQAQLLESPKNISHILSRSIAYVKSIFRPNAIQATVEIDPISGLPKGFSGKIIFDTPPKDSDPSFITVNELLSTADQVLSKLNMTVWILLDRLDVAFADSNELEGNALRALFRTYLDLSSLEKTKLKIFLRSDIWRRLTSSGFRESSHITKTMTIFWESNSLLGLLVRRLLNNPPICDFYSVKPEEVLSSIDKQREFFYRIFPPQVEVGPNKPNTLVWMITRTMDGTKQTAPRELIHLLNCARETQLRFFETGSAKLEGKSLFSPSALKQSLPEVSKVRLEQTLFAEYPNLRPYIEQLARKKTEQFTSTLAGIWRTTEGEALEIAKKLVDVGFFEHKGTNPESSFWVPFLYRDAANMIQGAAE